MKCDQCTHLNQDKTSWPDCISCIHRPHDLCCDDKFEEIGPDVTVNRWAHDKFTIIRAMKSVDAACFGFKEGTLAEWLRPEHVQLRRHLETIILFFDGYKDWLEEKGYMGEYAHIKQTFKKLKPPTERT